MELGLDAQDNLVLKGSKIYYNYNTGADGVVNLAAIGGGGGGLGPSLAYAPGAGVIDPAIAGFIAGLGSLGTGRINVTLAGNTSFEGLPAGIDGQQIAITLVAGNFQLTLLHNDASTAQSEIFGSNDEVLSLGDSASLYYDGGLGKWVLQP